VRAGLAAWIVKRKARLRPDVHPALAARFIIETIAVWAMHRHWDPAPPAVDERAARSDVATLLVHALVPDS
jgi:hypothetical protein